MKASELRIGNWIMENDIDKPFEVYAETFVDISNGYLPAVPIPLTEEWLIKFGFDRPFVPPVYERVTHGMDIRLRIHKVGDNVFTLGNYDTTSARIEYVHQLQNLYFALTGEELTSQ